MKCITHEYFLKELIKEQERLKKSTPYRYETAVIAYDLAYTLNDMKVYESRIEIKKYITNHFDLDEERVNDVSKFLNVIFNDLNVKLNMSEEIKNMLLEKIKKREAIKIETIQ